MNGLMDFIKVNFLIIILFLLCLLIPLQKWLLLLAPANLKFTILDIILILVFYFTLFLHVRKRSFLLNINKKQLQMHVFNQLILIIIFSLGLFTGLIASSPISQTKEIAEAQKEKLIFAAESGYKLCRQVTESKISEASVNDFIKNIYPSDDLSQETAQKVYQEFKKNPAEADKKAIIDKLLPTVPILYLEWTCNNYGCGYGDDQLVWTVSANNRNLGGIISLMSLVLILLTAQKNFKNNLITNSVQKPHA